MNESAIVDESSEIKEKPRKKAKRKRRRLCKPPKRRRTLHCPICLEELSLSVFATTVCRHQFCKLCMRRWIENQKVCPVCRKRLNNAWIRRTFKKIK
ncbi:hypothetical protein CDAR_376961 [Caerostris darwini]|uniref:RING-type domain-containing protein n=1 Tax=Caerostris darwini TaxID=1538125 RepID=A0AAV4PL07_9ARAC|nr:hypothetical protein CDAR_376961 [Caerostris darwini]